MEKLQPALKQIFWICTGLVVLLAVSGWWLAIGSLREQIDKDKSTLTTASKDAEAGKDAPNSVWTTAAKQVNAKHQQSFDLAERDLHSSQIKYRTYPESIAAELPRSFGDPIKETALRRQYAKLYNSHFVEQLRVLDPFIVQDNQGLISVALDDITHANVGKWKNNPPTASEIWNAQEDLWLLRSLFESISKVNDQAGAERLGKSPVRELSTLYLRGGTRTQAQTASAGTSGMGGRFGSAPVSAGNPAAATSDAGSSFMGMTAGQMGLDQMMSGMDDDDDEGWGAFGSTGGRGRSRSRQTVGRPFEGSFRNDLLTEEFGPAKSGRGGLGGMTPVGDGPGRFSDPGLSASTPSRSSGGITQNNDTKDGAAVDLSRYVDDAAEYRTRAFLLHVKVEPGYIPVLLAELTNSSFPVEIVRVEAQFTSGSSQRRGGRSAAAGPGAAAARNDDDDDMRFAGAGLFGNDGNLMGRSGLGGLGGRRFGGPAFPGGGRRGSGSAQLLATLASKIYNPNVAARGRAQLNAALGDPSLSELRIAGLLTVYRTKEENEAVEETSEMEIKDAQVVVDSSQDAAAETIIGGEAGDTPATEDQPGPSDDGASDLSDSESPVEKQQTNGDSTEPDEHAGTSEK